MKAKIAIEKLKTMYPKNCKMVNGRMQGGFDDTTCEEGEAINAAIKALEKQIPQMAVSDGSDEQDWVRCPSCKRIIGENDDIDISDKFCAYCGQALKF
ncbi:hypothetical protein [Lacrimispora sp.]|uniref:hypothetical protein n=1 Tax=Lacrimispora sp. TaxID=2719234 RepID=UPI0028A6577E|nr:hypothetical protein [Lacrimispora sp.]